MDNCANVDKKNFIHTSMARYASFGAFCRKLKSIFQLQFSDISTDKNTRL